MSENISKVKKVIEHALADGRLSREESDMILRAIYADKKFSPEEAKLWRELQDKVCQGEIALD